MSRYSKDPGGIYRQLREAPEVMDTIAGEDEGFVEDPTGLDNADSIASNFKDEFTDELIEVLREIAKTDQAKFDQNRDRLIADLEKVLRDPTINNVNARILVSKNEDEEGVIYNES